MLRREQSLAHDVFLQAQEQIDYFRHRSQASRKLLIQRMCGQQWLPLDGDLIEEARVYHHNSVSHGRLFGALDELQLRTFHHDGIPQDRHGSEAQRLEQLHQLVLYVRAALRGIISQTKDLCDLQRATE